MPKFHVLVAAAVVGILCSTSARAETFDHASARVFPQRVLALHNAARASAGVPLLSWDNQLGKDAAQYAVELALTGRFQHSSSAERRGAGENLWMGTRGAFSVEKMVANWENERRDFAAGVFPNVSRRGNWHGVGHYTQMIWPGTQRVGCAIATSALADYLVCRYFPAGNVMGARLWPRQAAAR
jgi:hypothetical protein